MALSEEEFSRLPSEMQAAVLEKRRLDEAAQLASEERVKRNCWIAAGLSGAGAIFIERLSGPTWPMYIILFAGAAAAGFWTVFNRYKLLGGAATIGGTCILLNVFGIVIGLIPLGAEVGTLMVMLCSWLFYLGMGGFLATWADGQRFRTSSGF